MSLCYLHRPPKRVNGPSEQTNVQTLRGKKILHFVNMPLFLQVFEFGDNTNRADRSPLINVALGEQVHAFLLCLYLGMEGPRVGVHSA